MVLGGPAALLNLCTRHHAWMQTHAGPRDAHARTQTHTQTCSRDRKKTKPSNNNPLTLVPSSWRREGLWERRRSRRILNTLSVASSGDWQRLNERFPASQLNYKLPGSTWPRGKDVPIHLGESRSCGEWLPGEEDGWGGWGGGVSAELNCKWKKEKKNFAVWSTGKIPPFPLPLWLIHS